MAAWKELAETKNNKVTVVVPDYLNNRQVEVIVNLIKKPVTKKKKAVKKKAATKKAAVKKPKYDFSDLVGKLKWNGDAVAEQKKLRDEWK
ncbi:MAG: hypothetical protein HYX40_01805 [Sphingobacteriales bacterium]|nr:hypothetical protein [Sphingobacteriales bacterium]